LSDLRNVLVAESTLAHALLRSISLEELTWSQNRNPRHYPPARLIPHIKLDCLPQLKKVCNHIFQNAEKECLLDCYRSLVQRGASDTIVETHLIS